MSVVDIGQLIFADNFAKTQHRGALKIRLNKPVAAIVIGSSDNIIWSSDRIHQTILRMGMVYSDDILEVVGKEQWEKIQAFVTEKYVTKKKVSS